MRFALFISLSLVLPLRADDLKKLIDPAANKLLESGKNIGFVVGVRIDGKNHVYGFGTVKLAGGTATPDGMTVFEIGSITKAFTGVLLADGVRRGEVTLDGPASKYLPDDVPLPKEIILEHLATHRSGLPVEPPFIGLKAKNTANPYADYDRAKLKTMLESLKPDEPGKKCVYSNLGAGLTGIALVHASKSHNYDALIKQRIARPLGMKDTGEAITGNQRARLAMGHDSKGKPTSNWDFATLEACGGIRSTVNDMLTFAAANLGDSKADIVTSMKDSHKPRADYLAAKAKIGLYWITSGDMLWHNGGTGGYRSMLAMLPKSKIAVVVLCASSKDMTDETALAILDAIRPKPIF